MLSEKDENLQLWTSQPRREYEPWRNHRQNTPFIRFYRNTMEKQTAGTIIKNIFMLILAVFVLLALVYYILYPDLLVKLDTVPELRADTHKAKTQPIHEHVTESSHSVPDPERPVFVYSQKSSWTNFLPDEKVTEICGKHGLLRWTNHSKPRKIYEFIYIDSNSPEVYNELCIHLDENYNYVNYFILASANDASRVDIGEFDGNCHSRKLWKFQKKIVTLVIQPASKANDPAIPSQALRIIVEPETSLECEQISRPGDTIYIHYTATLEDGTFIGSTYDDQKRGPISYTIGAGSMAGWDKGVRGMCIGENRTIVVPPTLGYGDNATGPIPANSTLIFEIELLAIKGDFTGEVGPEYTASGSIASRPVASGPIASKDAEVEYSVPDRYDASKDFLRTPFLQPPVTDPLANEHKAYTYNSILPQALPLLTGKKAFSEGDIILISRPDEIPTSKTLKVLRKCQIPSNLDIVSVISGYHYQGLRAAKSSRQRATFYAGEQTVLPDELQRFVYVGAATTMINQLTVEMHYCGPCFGASPPPHGDQASDRITNWQQPRRACCASCEEVRDAYESSPRAAGSANEHVEQCIRQLKPFERRIGFD